MSSLALTLLYLLAAVLGVVTCRSLKLPPMLGYLAAGVVVLLVPAALLLTIAVPPLLSAPATPAPVRR